MTDARLPERYLMDRRIVRLSDADCRGYFMATLWSVSNRTEGVITPEDLPLIPSFRASSPAVFLDAELWGKVDAGWYISDFAATQTTKAQLESAELKRMNDRERQARHRKKEVQFEPSPDSPVTRDITRDVTREDKGKASARQGQAEYLETSGNDNFESLNEQTGEVSAPVTQWPSAVPGSGGSTPLKAVESPKTDSTPSSTCRICNNQLVSAPSRAAGLCRKGDAAHTAARAAA